MHVCGLIIICAGAGIKIKKVLHYFFVCLGGFVSLWFKLRYANHGGRETQRFTEISLCVLVALCLCGLKHIPAQILIFAYRILVGSKSIAELILILPSIFRDTGIT